MTEPKDPFENLQGPTTQQPLPERPAGARPMPGPLPEVVLDPQEVQDAIKAREQNLQHDRAARAFEDNLPPHLRAAKNYHEEQDFWLKVLDSDRTTYRLKTSTGDIESLRLRLYRSRLYLIEEAKHLGQDTDLTQWSIHIDREANVLEIKKSGRIIILDSW